MSQRAFLKDRIKGMFLGIAIGDALGMPYEKLDSREIMVFSDGDVSVYRNPSEKHFLKGVLKAGDVTDDTQLSLAVANSLIACKGFNIEDQVAWHINALKDSTFGWGKGTTSAIERLIAGMDVRFSGTKNGAGNGVAMKISPLGALMAVMFFSDSGERRHEEFAHNAFDLALMTHRSAMAAASGWIQARLINYCFLNHPGHDHFRESFLVEAISACAEGESFNFGIDDIKERMVDRMASLLYDKVCELSLAEISSMYGKRPFFVYDSLPLAYACFLKNPCSIEALYDAIRAGGDTDTNASIVGALLGALNGVNVFPDHLIKGLNEGAYEKVMTTAYRFCETFVDVPTII